MSTPPTTVLGFDFGTRRIGVAIGQTLTQSARPLTTLRARDGQPDWQEVNRLLAEWRPDALVVGLPVHMDGSEHERTQAARRFGNRLHGRFQLPVIWMDERLTSDEAERRLREEGGDADEVDAVAAQLIVQSWLDQHALA
ncbi:MAG TPA: Holliday junction resolvase RuvX [Gammaproteobacteria bacterium]|nr:Holliday junction resolvase RuvX [Gammaproteobacteria bacterium]